MHVDIHYESVFVEYDFINHCNVFIEENKHRYFKKIVYYINHFSIEKTMLFRENLRQIVRLLLLNDFAHIEPEATQLIKNIHRNCSSLFMTLLFRSEQLLLKNDDSDFRLFKNIVENEQHIQFNAIGCLEFKYCRIVLKLSTRSFENVQIMSRSFKTAFRFVYDKDYEIFNLMHFEINVIQ